MELTVKFLTVLGLGVLELWAAIPAGLAMRLHPVSVGIAAAAGAMLSALTVILLGERVRTWLVQRHGKKEEGGRHEALQKVWRRYGVIGLGLLAPLLTGAPLGAALGLALGAPAGRLLFWTCIGVLLWSAGLTLAGALGMAGIETLWRR